MTISYKCIEKNKLNFTGRYQWREDFLSRPARNRESAMCTCITCSQSLAEVISRLLASSTQLDWKKRLLLLFLSLEPRDEYTIISIF